ncbi:MAG: BMP family protein [Actinomycetota bacterium]
MQRLRVPVLIAVLAVVAAACGGGGDGGGTGGGGEGGGTEEGCTTDFQVGVAYDIGGLGDKSFNDAAKAGLDRAIADGLVDEACTTVNEADATGSNRDANVQALAEGGYDLVVGVGFAFSEGIAALSNEYPDTNFMIVDGYSAFVDADQDGTPDAGPNVADYVFSEQEGSFLVGAAAALKCECDTIGFLGGQTGFLIGKFEAGYTAGAQAVNPDINVLVEYIGDTTAAFNDPTSGGALSNQMYDDGAEVVYHASGASGAGLFNAAVAKGKWAIGVDSDQYNLVSAEQQPWVLTSMIKRVDTAVYEAIAATKDGSFSSGQRVFGLADDGVGYSTANAELTSDITEQLEAYREQIIAGTIVVPVEP